MKIGCIKTTPLLRVKFINLEFIKKFFLKKKLTIHKYIIQIYIDYKNLIYFIITKQLNK